MPKKTKLPGPWISSEADALRHQVSETVTDELRLRSLQASYLRECETDASMPDVDDVDRARKICAKIPGLVRRHLSSDLKSTIVSIIEYDWRRREALYDGPYVAPPRPLDYEHMKGELRAAYMICQAAGLEPRAMMLEEDHATGLELAVDIATLIPAKPVPRVCRVGRKAGKRRPRVVYDV